MLKYIIHQYLPDVYLDVFHYRALMSVNMAWAPLKTLATSTAAAVEQVSHILVIIILIPYIILAPPALAHTTTRPQEDPSPR